jgi:mannitol/fructose-specific phosphotransferase system IIA component (Ntr-type)
MHLRDFLEPATLALPLKATDADAVLPELVGLLGLDQQATATLLKALRRREELGSTGVGRGFAIPHGRALVMNRVRLAYGHSPGGIPWRAVDDLPVHDFFLIVAPPPPLEMSNQYLPVLGKVAAFAKDPDVSARLSRVTSAEQFFQLLEEKGA